MQRVVDGNRAPRGQWHTLGTDRLPVTGWTLGILRLAVIRQPDDPEKYAFSLICIVQMLGPLTASSRSPWV